MNQRIYSRRTESEVYECLNSRQLAVFQPRVLEERVAPAAWYGF